ncbi:uncharacterized protein [Clinocottus analis]|uniref:uncharacterized protein n=1 Tax=Clinocottus analis TaxID=304258 RepID=UPI0035C1F826
MTSLCTPKVEPCGQEARSHAVSLLASLNLQRELAQFCDCVVRQRHSPGQLHPAHRCVLAASSPVLASILSSTGALVELQAPCLSDTVLALLLDYMYTGALPYSSNQDQYYNLLTVANYLQMDELQEALRTWRQTEGKVTANTNGSSGAENQPYKNIHNMYSNTVNNCSMYLPLSLEKEDHQYSANVVACDDIDSCRTSSTNGASSLSNASTCCSISQSSVNTGNCRQVIYLTPQDVIQNNPCIVQVHGVSGVDKGEQKDLLHSANSDSAGIEEKPKKTVDDRRSLKKQQLGLTEDTTLFHHLSIPHFKDSVLPSQCTSSSSSPHVCFGAVPVIRHSSRAAMLQLAEVSTIPHPYHPVARASASSIRAPGSQPGSTENDSIVKSLHSEQNQDHRNNKDHIGKQFLKYNHSSEQSDILKQDYNSSNEDDLIGQNDEHMSNALSHTTDDNDRHAYCDALSKNHTTHFRDNSVSQNKESCHFTRGLQYKRDLSFDDFSGKHRQLDCSDFHNVWMATAAEEQLIRSQDPRAVDTSPVQNSHMESDSHCEDLFSERDATAEHSYPSYPAETNRQDSRNTFYGLQTAWYPNLQRAERSTKDGAHIQHEHNRDPATTNNKHRLDLCQPVSTTPETCFDSVTGSDFERHTSVKPENMSGIKITEPHLNCTMSVDHTICDSACRGVRPSYRGHLQYYCLPQDTTHLSQRFSGSKQTQSSPPDHSDQSSDTVEVGTFASPGFSPLRERFAPKTKDQVLLLDITTKPAELLLANAFDRQETFENVNNDQEPWNEVTSAAGVDTKCWVGKNNVEGRKCVSTTQRRPVAEVIHTTGVVEGVSNPIDIENQATTLTVCSPPSVQAAVSSTSSACIPSSLSASLATNVPAHLSNPVQHSFQCSLCDRSFSQRGSLNRHVRSHLGVRPFPCPRCPMTFSRQYRVTEHMRVHQRCVLWSDSQQPPAASSLCYKDSPRK